MAMLPEYGNYNITMKDVESGDGQDDDQVVEQQGMPAGMLMNIIALVAFIVIVAVVLVVFIKRQSARMTEDRHKLRMAMDDAGKSALDLEDTSALFSGGNAKNSPNLAPLEETRQLLNQTADLPALPPASPNQASSASPPKPTTTRGKGQNANHMRASAGSFPFSKPGEQKEAGLYSDVAAYDNENGPVKELENLDKLHLMEEIGEKELETEARQKPKVEIEPGLSISLPAGKTKAFGNAKQVQSRQATAKPGSGFWSPPSSGGSWSPPDQNKKLDLSKAKKI
jgi:hypothetical protein